MISRITAITTANLTTLPRQTSFTDCLRYLAKARFSSFRKSFHTFSTTTIFRIKFLFLFFLNLSIIFRFILRIFSSCYIILDRTPITPTSLTSLNSNLSSSLGFRNNTYTRFSTALSMFTFSTTIFISFFLSLYRRSSLASLSIIGRLLTTHGLQYIQCNYNFMRSNNLRFHYQQKNQNFNEKQHLNLKQVNMKNIYQFDEQQQQQIVKKKIIQHQDTSQYAKKYSEVQIINKPNIFQDRQHIIKRKSTKILKNQILSKLENNKNNEQKSYKSRQQRLYQNKTSDIHSVYERMQSADELNINKRQKYQKQFLVRKNRGLSINHYNIYSSDQKLIMKTLKNINEQQIKKQNNFQIKIQFQDQTNIDLLQAKTPSNIQENKSQELQNQQLKITTTINNSLDKIDKIDKIDKEKKIQQTIHENSIENTKISFDLQKYCKIYQILKNIQKNVKSIADHKSTLIQIKNYMQIIASGGLDQIQGYDMPLHRLKIIKNALLYERIAIVMISFAIAIEKLRQSQKYILNLISYAINNNLMIIQVFQSSKINISQNQSRNIVQIQSDRLVKKKNHDTIRNNNDILLDAILKVTKYQEAFSQSFKDILKNNSKNNIQQIFYNVLEYFAFFLCLSGINNKVPFLAVAPNPYLKQSLDQRPTLVLDVIGIFCLGTKKSKIHTFRPYTEHFLQQMSKYYEIVSFTCGYPNQVDKVIDILDQHKVISHRLYRHHAIARNGMFFKDCTRIGRKLEKLIIIDSQANFEQNPQHHNNTIALPIWRGSRNDSALAQICPILAAIAVKKLDCSKSVQKIILQHQKNLQSGIKYLNFGINFQ